MSASPPLTDRRSPPGPPVREPVLKVTRYDRLSAWMISVVLALGVGVLAIVCWWMSTRPPRQEFLVPLEMVTSPGGIETGAENETLQVESPEDPSPEASTAEEVTDTTVNESLANVVELSDQASQQVEQMLTAESSSSGKPGSAQGTGKRALGSGEGDGGIPSEQRWFIRYADEASLTEYARQLDFFGLELGALMPNSQLIYLSHFTAPQATQRVATSGKDERRLYMTWQGGGRKAADVKLFADAGIDASRAVLFQFYPPAVEQLLLTKEYQFAHRKVQEIRRTYFTVTRSGNGYEFVVSRQTYLR